MAEIDASEPSIVDLYTRASAFFGEQVIAIGDEEWDLPATDEWIVKAVVAHVVVSEAQIPGVVDGRGRKVDADAAVPEAGQPVQVEARPAAEVEEPHVVAEVRAHEGGAVCHGAGRMVLDHGCVVTMGVPNVHRMRP